MKRNEIRRFRELELNTSRKMNRKWISIFLLLQILNNLKAAEIEGNGNETVIIRHSIGIPNDFNGKPIFKKFGSKYYVMAILERHTWYSAMQLCHTMGGHLINLTNNATLYAVSNVLKRQAFSNYWTDLSSLSQSGAYVSMTTGQNASYLNWCDDVADTEKINPSGNCVYIENMSSTRPCMKPKSCIQFMRFICESNMPRTVTIVTW